jgi:hypothetical protein
VGCGCGYAGDLVVLSRQISFGVRQWLWRWRSAIGCCFSSDFVPVVSALRWFLVLAVVLVELMDDAPPTVLVVACGSDDSFGCGGF